MNIFIRSYMHSSNLTYHMWGLLDTLVLMGIFHAGQGLGLAPDRCHSSVTGPFRQELLLVIFQLMSCDAGHVTLLLKSSEGQEIFF